MVEGNSTTFLIINSENLNWLLSQMIK